MKTLDQIKTRESQCLDGRDFSRLAQFIPEQHFEAFGLTMPPERVGTHRPEPYTREAVIAQLEKDVDFGFEKALNKRGISAGLMFSVVMMWNWVLEEGLEDYDEDEGYAQYGLPLFKATALKYGFPNPLGADAGTETQYESE